MSSTVGAFPRDRDIAHELVYGFIREAEWTLSIQSAWKISQSQLIMFRILSFYFIETDAWDDAVVYADYEKTGVSIDGDTLTNNSNTRRNSFLTNAVSKGIHEWHFKIEHCGSGWELIGIWDTQHDIRTLPRNRQIFYNADEAADHGYAYVYDFGYKMGDSTKQKYGSDMKASNGDTVTVILNMDALTLSFKLRDIDLGKAFDVKQGSYRVVSSSYGHQVITLLSYKQLDKKKK